MKNVFFTAIALVAFSAASLANTIEVKEEVVPAKENTSKEVEVTAACRKAGGIAYAGVIAAGGSDSDAGWICWNVIVACNHG